MHCVSRFIWANVLELRRVAFLLKADFLMALGVYHPKVMRATCQRVLLHVVFDYATCKYNDRIAESLCAEALQEMVTDSEWHERIVPGHSELPPIPKEILKEVTEQVDAEVESRVKEKLASREIVRGSKSKH